VQHNNKASNTKVEKQVISYNHQTEEV